MKRTCLACVRIVGCIYRRLDSHVCCNCFVIAAACSIWEITIVSEPEVVRQPLTLALRPDSYSTGT